jgi:hypothetical protein
LQRRDTNSKHRETIAGLPSSTEITRGEYAVSNQEDQDSDLLDSILRRAQEGTADRLNEQMRHAGSIKSQEELASKGRLEQMWVEEHKRQRSIAAAQAEQRRQEQRLVRLILVAAVVVVVIILLLAFILSQPGSQGSAMLSWL